MTFSVRLSYSQVIQNIAYSTAGQVVEKAFTAATAGRELAEIEGEGYTVRQTPPAYFFQESLRLQQEARSELKEFRLANSADKIAGQKERVRCALVLLRHGQSRYNQEKVFTGWAVRAPAWPRAEPWPRDACVRAVASL